MDEEEFFDFESALVNELFTTTKRFIEQNPQMSEEQKILTVAVATCRLFITMNISSGLPREASYEMFDAIYRDVLATYKELT